METWRINDHALLLITWLNLVILNMWQIDLFYELVFWWHRLFVPLIDSVAACSNDDCLEHQHTWSTSILLCQHRSPGHTTFQTFHYRRPSFSSCRLTDLEQTTRNSRFGINTAVIPAPIENFPISMSFRIYQNFNVLLSR